MSSAPIAYLSYDRFPVAKGASVHIRAFTNALAAQYGSLDLVTVPADTTTATNTDYPSGVCHTGLAAEGRNVVERVIHWRREVANWHRGRKRPVVHVRSIFEGYPIACDKANWCDKFVYEVNGLPSVEMKYHHPAVADDSELIKKLSDQEDKCLAEADLLLTVSPVNAGYLIARGANPWKIRVIPNGVDTSIFTYQKPTPWRDRVIRALYCGTLARWQGVHNAIEAVALYRRDFPATLTIVGDVRSRQRREIEKFCDRRGMLEHVTMLDAVEQSQLAILHHEHDVVLAPLRPNDRNLRQGCCPLKMLEAMASGTPLIASDMPVTQSLAVNGRQAILVRPGSAKAIKDGMLRLKENPGFGELLSKAARQHIETNLTWQHATDELLRAYQDLGVL